MRISFRQGIVSHDSTGFLHKNNVDGVDIVVSERPTIITIADRTANYTFSEDLSINNAWVGPFDSTITYWLYWQFDLADLTRTFESTTVEPTFGAVQPPSPLPGQLWYNTITNEYFKYDNGIWSRILAVLTARLENNTFSGLGINAPQFTGTQIGVTTSVLSGRIIRQESGTLLRKLDGTFLTAEDQLFVDTDTSAIRLESNVVRAQSTEPSISAYSIVAYNTTGGIRTAQYADAQSTICAVSLESLALGEVGVIVPQGIVTNDQWSFSDTEIGSPLWIDNGLLVSRDPHVTNVIQNPIPATPVARILSSISVLFEQGLGGIGPRGPVGSLAGLPGATVSSLGAVIMATQPTNPTIPIAVGDNDPRLLGGPFAPIVHLHGADTIAFTPTSTLSSVDVQAVISELDTNTASISGATFTGPVVLSGDPASALEATTMQYVDGELQQKADIDHQHDASSITLLPVGTLTSTDLQAYAEEIDASKVNRSGDTISGDLNVDGDFEVSTDTSLIGDLNVGGNVTVTGPATFDSAITAQDDIDIVGNLTVAGETELDDVTADVLETASLASNDITVINIDVTGPATLTDTLTVAGDSTLATTTIDAITVTNAATFGGVVTLSADPTQDLEAATRQYVDNSVAGTTLSELPYDLTFFISGAAAAVDNNTVGLIVCPRTVRIDANVANVYGKALTPPTQVVVFNILAETAIIGTITFDPTVDEGRIPTFNIPTQAVVPANAIIEIQPTTQELEIQDVAITIIGCTTDLTCPV